MLIYFMDSEGMVNPTLEEINEGIELLKKRVAWIKENCPFATSEINNVESAIISLKAWTLDLKYVTQAEFWGME